MEGRPVPESKAELRQSMLARRRAWPAAERDHASARLCSLLASWLHHSGVAGHAGATLGVYLASPWEANLDGLIQALLVSGIPVAAPRVDLQRDEISFWRLPSLQSVETGVWGLREPHAVEPGDTLDLVLVPGVAFDAWGSRLGMGGGWYDRFLAGGARSVGIAFDWQLVAEVPCESHDRAVEAVVTPGGWFSGGVARADGPDWDFD